MKRVLVTGASGFLGRHLIEKLREDGIQVTALLHHLHKDEEPEYDHCIFGDVSNGVDLDGVLVHHGIDTVFHLAAVTEVAVGFTDPAGTFEANIRGTWKVLDACRRQKIGRVIISSSDKAYGRTPPPYREDLPLLPDRPYETSKACVDLLARTYASSYGMSISTTRCVNLYGPGCMSLSTLIPNTIRRVLRGERPLIRNGGAMRRDWLYISDAVDGYMKLADSKFVGPINFGSGNGITVKETVQKILRLMKSSVEPIDEADKQGEIVDQWTDASLAKKALGWTPSHSLEEGLSKTIEWYKNYFAVQK